MWVSMLPSCTSTLDNFAKHKNLCISGGLCQSYTQACPEAFYAEYSIERLDYSDWVAPVKIMSTAFSAIMMVGALVLPVISCGMIDASTTRKFCMP